MFEGPQVRAVRSPVAAEIYLAATPTKDIPVQQQAKKIFLAIRNKLVSENARILQERIFVTEDVMETVRLTRTKSYGHIDDGVSPSFLIAKQGLSSPLAGVQVHAVSSNGDLQVVKLDGSPCGRLLTLPDRMYLTLSAISAHDKTGATQQARAMLEKAESTLKKFNADMHSVARTWMWLGDILAWYSRFNQVRNKFFTQRGILEKNGGNSMPASTGIGLSLAGGGHCAMDLIAVLEPRGSTMYLPAIGKQQCAFNYGSAFSRASRAITPAGRTVFVSGTAAVDKAGATTNIDDPLGQINATIDNVRAVLNDMNCRDEDVVQTVAYCKTIEVEKLFNKRKKDIPWPWVTLVCDICRPDLLFEIEATVCLPEYSYQPVPLISTGPQRVADQMVTL
jgi:enamine deaminase RidA (YjgF/YER057c/UK114 family)